VAGGEVDEHELELPAGRGRRAGVVGRDVIATLAARGGGRVGIMGGAVSASGPRSISRSVKGRGSSTQLWLVCILWVVF
jgi:hypothetical protein